MARNVISTIPNSGNHFFPGCHVSQSVVVDIFSFLHLKLLTHLFLSNCKFRKGTDTGNWSQMEELQNCWIAEGGSGAVECTQIWVQLELWEENCRPSPTEHGLPQSHEHGSRAALEWEAFPSLKYPQLPLHNHELQIQAPHAHALQCIHEPTAAVENLNSH